MQQTVQEMRVLENYRPPEDQEISDKDKQTLKSVDRQMSQRAKIQTLTVLSAAGAGRQDGHDRIVDRDSV